MWEVDLLKTIPDSRVLTRQELYNLFKTAKSELSYNSVGWLIETGLKENLLFKVGADSYSTKNDERKIYEPSYSDYAKEVLSTMEELFPELEYTVFELLQLNEFVNHLYSQNIIVLQIEKDLCSFTFESLSEKYSGKVLYKPSVEDLGRYKSNNCIILENRISESPCDKTVPHSITLEKLLVDCVADKIIHELIPSSEIANIYENANLVYRTDITKIRRYARRRNVWGRVEELMKVGESE